MALDPAPTTPPPGPLSVSVLGPLRAERDGVDLPLGGRRQRAVLATARTAWADVVHDPERTDAPA